MVARRLLIVGAVLAGLSLLLGGWLYTRSGAAPPRRAIFVLFDLSRSTDGPAVRQRYLRGFATVLRAAEKGSLVGADVIDHNPLAHAFLPITVTFRGFDALSDNRLAHGEQMEARRTRALALARRVLARRPGRAGTCILDALTLAGRFFANYPDVEERYLVLFSDMVEECDRYGFTRKNLRPVAVARFIARERAAGRLPGLGGVQVYAVGAGAVAGREQTASAIRAIQSFWLSYFRAAAADLPPARYGAALVRFP